MPTYEYMCTSCKHEWEAFQSMRDDPLKKCPKCKKRSAKRLISLGGGFILKGGGWYADLYSSTGKKSGGVGSSSSDKSSSPKSSSGKSSSGKSSSGSSSSGGGASGSSSSGSSSGGGSGGGATSAASRASA